MHFDRVINIAPVSSLIYITQYTLSMLLPLQPRIKCFWACL